MSQLDAELLAVARNWSVATDEERHRKSEVDRETAVYRTATATRESIERELIKCVGRNRPRKVFYLGEGATVTVEFRSGNADSVLIGTPTPDRVVVHYDKAITL